ncbi:MAG: hypothetical protein ACTSWX_13870 [Promethearchaeota archaeon]
MKKLNWEILKQRYKENPISYTKTRKEFRISRVTNTAIYTDLQRREEYISRENLEKAIDLINNGIVLEGPADYKRLVYDQRPAYAWAILRDMGFVH